jgi:hypothetical protein
LNFEAWEFNTKVWAARLSVRLDPNANNA